jgi:hypothetical protein
LTILRAYIVAGRPLQGKIWHLGGLFRVASALRKRRVGCGRR